tara:strand:- start:45 stop:173 length:129 start_codon:yes stop_codon:yes gene_type:complete
MARDIGEEINQLDLAYLFGKIKRPKYLKVRNALKLDFLRRKK